MLSASNHTVADITRRDHNTRMRRQSPLPCVFLEMLSSLSEIPLFLADAHSKQPESSLQIAEQPAALQILFLLYPQYAITPLDLQVR